MNYEFREAFVSSTTVLIKTKSLLFFPILKTLFVFSFFLGAILPAFAIRPSWAGRPDNTFGNSGKVTNRFNSSDSISDVAVQPDGKIVTANLSFVSNSNYDFGVSRYNRNGSIDLSFGNQGNTITDLANSSDQATSIALQTDGKILVSGYTGIDIFKPVVVRYTADGQLDVSFGTGGIALFQNVIGQFYDSEVQPDGKILLGGFTFDLSGNNQADFFLVRLLENGQLDPSFGTGGIVTTDFSITPTPTPTPTPSPSVRTNVALAANGGVASASSESAGNYSAALTNNGIRTWSNVGGWRDGTINVFPDFLQIDFNSAKTINQIDVYAVADDFSSPTEPTDADTFTLFGITDFDVQYWDGSNWITVPNGSIRNNNKIITRVAFPALTTTRIRVLVLNGQGGYSRIVEVEAFTANEPPTTPPGVSGSDIIRDLALQPDGKIIAVGTNDLSATRGDFAIARYNSNGQLDTSFDTDGKLTTDFSGEHDEARAIALQTDGKFVVGGFATEAGRKSALVRYNSDGTLDTTFASGGKLTTDISFYGFLDIAILPNNKIIAGTTIDNNFALVRYNVNGMPDPTFDFDGIVQTSFPGQSFLNAIVLQPDGKLVAGGSVFNPATRITSNALARYNLPIAHADFDGDNRTDLSVFRPEEGIWYLQQTRLGFAFTQLGSAADTPAAADYDGDGIYDIAIFSAGVWTVLQSLDGTTRTVQLGQAGDIPVPGDYDRDGSDDFAVFRDGNWRILGSTNNQIFEINFGQAGDIPVPADYDHDGQLDVAVYRAGVWFLQKSTEGFAVIPFGIASDIPVIGDFDGDGRADQTVFRNGIWYLNLSRDGFAAVQFGLEGDIPLTGDFDGDDITDIAVYRNGFWYVLNSSAGFSAAKFGQAGDRPIPIARLQ